MFGECHAHIFMNGYDYRKAVAVHKNGVSDAWIHNCFQIYRQHNISFIRDGGDALGVSRRAKEFACEYGIDYRTPVFAIHKNGYYGKIVGLGFDTLKDYYKLVLLAKTQGCDFIKIMISGIMDFNEAGRLTCESLPAEEIREMIHIAHEEGCAVMAHANGKEAVFAAANYGVDSIEHGNFIDRETLEIMAERQTLYVPTASTISNLLGCGRFPDAEIQKILELARQNIRTAYQLQVPAALGSDAGAYQVFHGQGLLDEYRLFQEILGASPEVDFWLAKGETALRDKFQLL